MLTHHVRRLAGSRSFQAWIAAAAVGLSCAAAFPDDLTWINQDGDEPVGLFSEPLNWSPAQAPVAGDTIIFNLAKPTTVQFDQPAASDTLQYDGGSVGFTSTGALQSFVLDGSANVAGGTLAIDQLAMQVGTDLRVDGTAGLTVDQLSSITGTSTGWAIVGDTSGQMATLTVRNGASISGFGMYEAGLGGDADVTIESGGSVSATEMNLAVDPASQATVRVQGVGSQLNSQLTMVIGEGGSGHLIVDDQAEAQCEVGYVGFGDGSSGQVDILGNGHWSSGGSMNVGLTTADISSTGIITVGTATEAGRLTVGGMLRIWAGGAVNVNDGSTVTVDALYGTSLNLSADSLLKANQFVDIATSLQGGHLHFGHAEGATEAQYTHLTGNSIDMAGDLVIGSDKAAGFLVQAGATMSSAVGMLGREGPATGTVVTLDGAGAQWDVAETLYVAGSATAAGGQATLDLQKTSNVTVGQSLVLWDDALVKLSGSAHLIVGQGIGTDSSVRINAGGTVTGNGQIMGGLVNDAGQLSPGHSIGTLNVTGFFSQHADGRMIMELVDDLPNQFDRLEVSGTGTLNGTLELVVEDDSLLALGDEMAIIDAGFRSARFDRVDGVNQMSNGLSLAVIYNTREAVVRVSRPGDVTLDDVIDEADLAWLADGWKEEGEFHWASGDLTGDGVINEADLAFLADNWKQPLSPPAVVTAVPEPATITMLGIGLAGLRRGRRSA